MGQYYKPMLVGTNDKNETRPLAWLYSHDYQFEFTRADGSSCLIGTGLKLMEHSWLKNTFVNTVERLLTPGNAWHMKPIVWAGDYADDEPNTSYTNKDGRVIDGINLYGFCGDENKIRPKHERRFPKKFRYIVNHDLKQYVDKNSVPDSDGWKIHPLPLLTCEGNNRGGGDFRGKNKYIGTWARHRISVETNIPEGYTEIKPDFIE